MDNKPEYILIHCSAFPASSADRFDEINNEHEARDFDRSSLGYYVGYHVLLTGGKKYRARIDSEHGDHCNDINFVGESGYLFSDHNSLNFHSLAICVDFDGDDGPVPAWAVPMLKAQIGEWMLLYGIPLANVRFHRDFTSLKTCPGSTITHDWVTALLGSSAVPQKDPPAVSPAPVDTTALRTKITLLQTLLGLLQELLHLKQKQGLGLPESSMSNEITLPAWYQSTSGPGISATLISIAGNVIPLINFMLQSKGIYIAEPTVDFWITMLMFVGFSSVSVIGYVRAKLTLGRQVAALQGQVQAMGAAPVV